MTSGRLYGGQDLEVVLDDLGKIIWRPGLGCWCDDLGTIIWRPGLGCWCDDLYSQTDVMVFTFHPSNFSKHSFL